jgi:hypothetical protein
MSTMCCTHRTRVVGLVRALGQQSNSFCMVCDIDSGSSFKFTCRHGLVFHSMNNKCQILPGDLADISVEYPVAGLPALC